MLKPLKWDDSTLVVQPLCDCVDNSLHRMLATDAETFWLYAGIITRGVNAKGNFQLC
jgi:hypothetical protein